MTTISASELRFNNAGKQSVILLGFFDCCYCPFAHLPIQGSAEILYSEDLNDGQNIEGIKVVIL